MPATYDSIATTTLGSAAASITFNSIPGTFTDLRLVFFGRDNAAANNLWFRFNNTSTTDYSITTLGGNGTVTESFRQSNQTRIDLQSLSTTIPLLATLDVFSYAGSTNKTCLAQYSGDRNGSGNTISLAGLWRYSSAITRVDVLNSSGDFAAGTTATLYGILRA